MLVTIHYHKDLEDLQQKEGSMCESCFRTKKVRPFGDFWLKNDLINMLNNVLMTLQMFCVMVRFRGRVMVIKIIIYFIIVCVL